MRRFKLLNQVGYRSFEKGQVYEGSTLAISPLNVEMLSRENPEDWEEVYDVIVSDSDITFHRYDGWINVKDKLPSNYQECIIYSEGDVCSGIVYDQLRDSFYDNVEGLNVHEHVTHWMPLPKPPTE